MKAKNADQDEMAYCGRCKCGKVIVMMIDNGKSNEKTAQLINIWIRAGLKIERHSIPSAQQAFTGCECPKQDKLF